MRLVQVWGLWSICITYRIGFVKGDEVGAHSSCHHVSSPCQMLRRIAALRMYVKWGCLIAITSGKKHTEQAGDKRETRTRYTFVLRSPRVAWYELLKTKCNCAWRKMDADRSTVCRSQPNIRLRSTQHTAHNEAGVLVRCALNSSQMRSLRHHT